MHTYMLLQICFEKELKEAKAVVIEPPQPKIKLKVPPGQETPASVGAKRITIHVKDTKSSGAPSPAPQSGLSSASSGPDTIPEAARGLPAANGAGLLPQHPQLEKTRSTSVSGASPSPSFPSAKQEVNARPSPPMIPRVNGTLNGVAPSSHQLGTPQQNGHHVPVPPPPPPIWDKKVRAPGRGALRDVLYLVDHN